MVARCRKRGSTRLSALMWHIRIYMLYHAVQYITDRNTEIWMFKCRAHGKSKQGLTKLRMGAIWKSLLSILWESKYWNSFERDTPKICWVSSESKFRSERISTNLNLAKQWSRETMNGANARAQVEELSSAQLVQVPEIKAPSSSLRILRMTLVSIARG